MHSRQPIEISTAKLRRQLRFQEQLDLYDYWLGIRGSHAIPARADLDPVDIPHILPHIGLIDIVWPGPRFRYRLVGTALEARFTQGLRGRFVEDCKAPDYAAYLQGVYSLPLGLSGPVLIQERSAFVTGFERAYSRLLLPLGRDRRTPNMILYSTMSEADTRHRASTAGPRREAEPGAATAIFAAAPAAPTMKV